MAGSEASTGGSILLTINEVLTRFERHKSIGTAQAPRLLPRSFHPVMICVCEPRHVTGRLTTVTKELGIFVCFCNHVATAILMREAQ